MIVRTVLLAPGAAILLLASPAAAQDYLYELEPLEEPGSYSGTWEGEWQGEDTWRGMWHGAYTDLRGRTVEGQYRGTFIGESQFQGEEGVLLLHDDERGWHEGDDRHTGYDNPGYDDSASRSYRDLPASPDGRLGYTMAQREAWLSDCRALYSGGYYDGYQEDYYRKRRRGHGGVAGGVLGAVVGGIAGNRIADSERLGGTLIGAGVGGLAGLAIGSAIDAASRERGYDDRMAYDEQVYAAQYCDAYLRRYESGAHGGFNGYAAYAQPVMMMVAAPHGARGHNHGPECRTIVTEEWVEVPAQAPSARRVIAPRAAPPAREPGKLTPIR